MFDGKIKTVTVSMNSAGKYYASLLFDDGMPDVEISSEGKAVGVDVIKGGVVHAYFQYII
jgi:putative transposase